MEGDYWVLFSLQGVTENLQFWWHVSHWETVTTGRPFCDTDEKLWDPFLRSPRPTQVITSSSFHLDEELGAKEEINKCVAWALEAKQNEAEPCQPELDPQAPISPSRTSHRLFAAAFLSFSVQLPETGLLPSRIHLPLWVCNHFSFTIWLVYFIASVSRHTSELKEGSRNTQLLMF